VDPGFAEGGGPWQMRGVRAYNGMDRAPSKVKGQSPWWVGVKSPEAESIDFVHFHTKEAKS